MQDGGGMTRGMRKQMLLHDRPELKQDPRIEVLNCAFAVRGGRDFVCIHKMNLRAKEPVRCLLENCPKYPMVEF